MIAWELVGRVPVPGNDAALSLFKRDQEFSIRMDGRELMNSRLHGSEEALSELACARIADHPGARVLIGGLGMGFTLAAALRRLGDGSRVEVAELVPEVVEWNRGPLAHLAGHPLADERVTVRVVDVARILKEARSAYDIILLDVDNGPEGLTSKGNAWLYARAGLAAALCGPAACGCAGRMVGRSRSGLCRTVAPKRLCGGGDPGAGTGARQRRAAYHLDCRSRRFRSTKQPSVLT